MGRTVKVKKLPKDAVLGKSMLGFVRYYTEKYVYEEGLDMYGERVYFRRKRAVI